MRHNVFGKQLSRDTGHRQALLKGLAGAIIRSEAIETTQAKALAAKGLIEKLVTKARRGNLNDIREIEAVIPNKELVHKLVHEIAPRFKSRSGGYLRLIKLGARSGDNAAMVRMEFLSQAKSAPPPPPAADKSSSPPLRHTKRVLKKPSKST